MRARRHLDRDTAERLLDGRAEISELDDTWAGIADLVTRAATTSPAPIEDRTLAALSAAVLLTPTRPARKTRPMIAQLLTVKAAAAAFVALGATGAAASAGVLPAPMQDTASSIAETVGIEIDGSDDVTDTPTTTVPDGDDTTDATVPDGDDTPTTTIDDTPDTTVPDTTVPDTTVPETPDTTVPDGDGTDTPDTTVPDTTVPDSTDGDEPAVESKRSPVADAVHDAQASTPPGPERGKAVSEAARNAAANKAKANVEGALDKAAEHLDAPALSTDAAPADKPGNRGGNGNGGGGNGNGGGGNGRSGK